VQPAITQQKLDRARARDVFMGFRKVSSVKYLNDGASGRGLIAQKAQHIVYLVNAARVEEPWAVGAP
jgi:hypothetical protein